MRRKHEGQKVLSGTRRAALRHPEGRIPVSVDTVEGYQGSIALGWGGAGELRTGIMHRSCLDRYG